MSAPVKLLVIDDDQVDRLRLKKALKTSGFQYELTECEDIQHVANSAFLNSFDCIFLDYVLPGDNGLSFLLKIRDTGIKTPIVITTAHGNESIAVELMKAGASDYILKNDISGQALGQIVRNVLRFTEMTREREDAEKALRVSESRLATAQRIAKIGHWEFDTTTEAIYWSSEVYNILARENGIFSPTLEKFIQCVHVEDRILATQTLNEALQGKPFSIDLKVDTPVGVKYTHAHGHPVYNANGQAEKLIGTLQDITERKLAEQEIFKSRELADKSMKVREIFLANMSHEIRTPMNAILGFTRLLYETNLSAEQKSFIDAIHFSGENLLVIINDILDLSKIQSGKMTLEKCDFNIHELVSGNLSVLRPKAQEKGLSLSVKMDQQLPPRIKGDPVRLNQVLTNLISNAIKFTERGGVVLEINSTAIEKDDISIEFKVKDTGIGISSDKLALVFDNFAQASNDTTRRYGGTGLGLAIVKNLVELQEGEISVISTPGFGSTFTVHLPYEKVKEGTMEFGAQIMTSHESLDLLGDIAVLVVEDNAVNQLLVKKVLQKTGCKIDIASNGLEALDCIKFKKYDVILMDVQMPEMDGYEATQHIRTKLPSPMCDVPIIAMTAHAFGSDVTRCISAGMNDYISKPFKPEDLFSKIIKHMKPTDHTKVISLHQSDDMLKYKIDLNPIFQLCNGDAAFLNELILVYDKQTPAFVEKLRSYTKSHNFEAVKSVCHQIKSSYGLLKMSELDKVLLEISMLLTSTKPETEFPKITNLVNVIISLISCINEEVKRGLRKTG
jgi:CheY-like chemotaxis protein